MNFVKEAVVNDNNASCSKGLKFLGVPIIGTDGKLLNGEHVLSDGTVARFVDGFLDGNTYDEKGNVIGTVPALEYEFGGAEYWEKGLLHGFPAVSQVFGSVEEDWERGQIVKLRQKGELKSFS